MLKLNTNERKPEVPFAKELTDLELEDEAVVASLAPVGVFTSRGLDPLVKATNMILPLFGQDATYPKIPDTKKLPVDFTRLLIMFSTAVQDAIEADVLADEMEVDYSWLSNDTSLLTLAGKLQMLSKDKGFKKFLLEPPPEQKQEQEDTTVEEPKGMTTEDEDALLMTRL